MLIESLAFNFIRVNFISYILLFNQLFSDFQNTILHSIFDYEKSYTKTNKRKKKQQKQKKKKTNKEKTYKEIDRVLMTILTGQTLLTEVTRSKLLFLFSFQLNSIS